MPKSLLGLDRGMGGQLCLSRNPTGDDGGNHRVAMLVAGVILYDKYGASAALLGTDARRQVGIKHIAPSDFPVHKGPPFLCKSERRQKLCLRFLLTPIKPRMISNRHSVLDKGPDICCQIRK